MSRSSPRIGSCRSACAFVLASLAGACLASSGVGCGQDVLVGRWELRSDLPDAGLEADVDAGRAHNPQAASAERARERARVRAINESDPHDNRPDEKRH